MTDWVKKNLVLLILLIVPYESYSNSKIHAWRYNNKPSIALTEKKGLIESNNSLMSDSIVPENFIRTEDIFTETGSYVSHFFVRFTKKMYTSYVCLKVFDSFTDDLIAKFRFDESGVSVLNTLGAQTDRIYMRAEIFGQDVELRSIGAKIIPTSIAQSNDLTLASTKLKRGSDILCINAQLKEEAIVSLYVYNQRGDICAEILDNKPLDSGSFLFYWNPEDSPNPETGQNYYLWFKASNLRSQPVEYVYDFYLVP